MLYSIAFVRGDEGAMQQEVAQAAGRVYEPIIDLFQGHGECAQGKIAKAREAYARGAAAAQTRGNSNWRAVDLAGEASCDAQAGFVQEARQTMNAALAVSESREVRADGALVLAQIGDTAGAEKLMTDLGKEFPYDTLLTQMKIPTARAMMSVQRNQAAQAVATLDAARPYELGADRRATGGFLAIYTRGGAFLHLHDGVKAAAEYQKILDHRGVGPTSVLYSLAHLGLGRAYVLQGDAAKAKVAYQDFFAVWKGADADVPVLKTARAEYEKLK
jgi:hypothetical protein